MAIVIAYEHYTDEAAFRLRLRYEMVIRTVTFEGITTIPTGAISFPSDYYRESLGAIIEAANGGGQYVSQTFGHPDHFVPVSGLYTYAAGPPDPNRAEPNVTTYVTFESGESAGKVSGFGAYFIDANHPLDGASGFVIYDKDLNVLAESGVVAAEMQTGVAVFHGIVAIDTETNEPVHMIAQVKLTTGVNWPDQNVDEGVVLDDLIFDAPVPVMGGVPEPATLALLAAGGLLALRRRRAAKSLSG